MTTINRPVFTLESAFSLAADGNYCAVPVIGDCLAGAGRKKRENDKEGYIMNANTIPGLKHAGELRRDAALLPLYEMPPETAESWNAKAKRIAADRREREAAHSGKESDPA